MQPAQPAPQKAPRMPRPYDKWNPAFNPQLLTKFEGIYQSSSDLDKERNADESLHSDIMQPADQSGNTDSIGGISFNGSSLPPPPPPDFNQFRKELNHLCEKTGELLRRYDTQKNRYDACQNNQEAKISDLWRRIKSLEDEKDELKRHNNILRKRYNNVGQCFQNYRDKVCSYRKKIFDQITYQDNAGYMQRVQYFNHQSQDLCYEFAQGQWENDYPYGDGFD